MGNEQGKEPQYLDFAKVIFVGPRNKEAIHYYCNGPNTHYSITKEEDAEENLALEYGVDFIEKEFKFNPTAHTPKPNMPRKMKIQCWEISPLEKFSSIIPMYIKGAQIAVIVCDTSSRPNRHKELIECENWIQSLTKAGYTKMRKVLFCISGEDDLEELDNLISLCGHVTYEVADLQKKIRELLTQPINVTSNISSVPANIEKPKVF